MKKIVALTFGLISTTGVANAAINWWLQPTVCRIDNTKCYPALGTAGIDPEMWDASGKCRGMKYICPDALVDGGKSPVLMGKSDIASTSKISKDFDTNVFNTMDDCYGVRRTTGNGSQTTVNGRTVNVYCPGVLDDPDEFVPNGEIEYDTGRPTCAELANNGYAAILNGNCYGKYYDPMEYYIECGSGLAPTCIVVLNGADTDRVSCDTSSTLDAAAKVFDTMYETSRKQHEKYFND